MSLATFAAPPDDWEKKFREVLAYDRYAASLKNEDGTWRRPKKEVIATLAALKKEIQAAAAKLGVDPRAIAGSILAENSLNVSVSDNLQDLLVKTGLASGGSIFGKEFSFGLGQLNFSAAREAENHVAALEKRKPISDEELQTALITPAKAVYQVGAVIRFVQDTYKAQGFDISKDPGVLATLYNLGDSEQKAAALRAKGGTPRVNYFGLFNQKYMSQIETAVGWSPPPQSVTTKLAASPPTESGTKVSGSLSSGNTNSTASAKSANNTKVTQANVSANTAGSPTKKTSTTKAATSNSDDGPPLQLKTVATKDLVLYQSPPKCDHNRGNSQREVEEKYRNFKNFASTGVLQSGMSFKEISPDLDCEMNPWMLVKDVNGLAGWVKKSELEASKEERLIPPVECDHKLNEACAKAVQAATSEYALPPAAPTQNGAEEKLPTTFVMLKPISRDSGRVSFKKVDSTCGYGEENSPRISKARSKGMKGGGANPTPIRQGYSVAEVAQSAIRTVQPNPRNDLSDLKKFLIQVEKKFGKVDSFAANVVTNPYELSQSLSVFQRALRDCLADQASGNANCDIELEKFKSVVEKIKIERKPSMASLDELDFRLQPMISSLFAQAAQKRSYGRIAADYRPSATEVESLTKAEVADALLECSARVATKEPPHEAKKTPNKATYSPIPGGFSGGQGNLPANQMGSFGGSGFPSDGGSGSSSDGSRNGDSWISGRFLENKIRERSELARSMTEDQWGIYSPLFIRLARACTDALVLIGDKKPISSATAIACVPRPESVFFKNREVALSLLEKLLKGDVEAQQEYLSMQLDLNFDDRIFHDLLQEVNPSPQTQEKPVEFMASYCPNKTAEFIEELLEKHPCINTVYVPDPWLLGRLNELGPKIIYRPFLQDDRYAIDIATQECI